MSQREKRLLLLVGLTVSLWLGNRGLASYRKAVEQASESKIAAETSLADAQRALIEGTRARSQLNRWRRQSLPTNSDVAESLYQDWLKGQLVEAGLQVTELRDKSPLVSRAEYHSIENFVAVQGALDQLLKFLENFYAANHLHRISNVTLTPTDDRNQIKISLSVDGLILPDCARSDALAEGPGPLSKQLLDDAHKTILARNPFALYSPPNKTATNQQDDPIASAASDAWANNKDAALNQLTGILGGMIGGIEGRSAQVFNTSTGRMRTFRQGDEIEFGELHAVVSLIDQRRMIMTTPQGSFEVRLGQKFSEAIPVDPPPAQA